MTDHAAREALRQRLIDAELSVVHFIAGDGYPSIGMRSNEDAADVALSIMDDALDAVVAERVAALAEDEAMVERREGPVVSAGRDLRDEAAEAAAGAFDEWLFRMHGVTSSCSHEAEGRGIADAVLAVVEPRIRAEALRAAADFLEADADAAQGHANPRDYEIVAWLREKAAASTGEGDR